MWKHFVIVIDIASDGWHVTSYSVKRRKHLQIALVCPADVNIFQTLIIIVKWFTAQWRQRKSNKVCVRLLLGAFLEELISDAVGNMTFKIVSQLSNPFLAKVTC